MKVNFFFSIIIVLLFACNRREVKQVEEFDDEKLTRFLIKTSSIVTKHIEYTVIVFLQNEECICEASHILITNKLLNSTRFQNYKKILFTRNSKHSVLNTELPSDLFVFSNDNLLLERHGILNVTDRILVYENRVLTRNYNLHNETELDYIAKDLGL